MPGMTPEQRAIAILTELSDNNAGLTLRGTFLTVHAGRLPLPPGLEAVLLHPEWDGETIRAYWYWWPMSEAW